MAITFNYLSVWYIIFLSVLSPLNVETTTDSGAHEPSVALPPPKLQSCCWNHSGDPVLRDEELCPTPSAAAVPKASGLSITYRHCQLLVPASFQKFPSEGKWSSPSVFQSHTAASCWESEKSSLQNKILVVPRGAWMGMFAAERCLTLWSGMNKCENRLYLNMNGVGPLGLYIFVRAWKSHCSVRKRQGRQHNWKTYRV